jgi:hypothetical protein
MPTVHAALRARSRLVSEGSFCRCGGGRYGSLRSAPQTSSADPHPCETWDSYCIGARGLHSRERHPPLHMHSLALRLGANTPASSIEGSAE